MSRWLQQSFIYSGYIVKTHFKLLGMINLFFFCECDLPLHLIFFFPWGIAACQQVKSLLPLSVVLSWRMTSGCVAMHWPSLMPNQLQPRSRWFKARCEIFSRMQYNHKCCHLTVFYFQTPEGSKWFSVWRVPLSDCSGNAPSGHWSFSSQAHDWSAVVLHQEQW